MSHGVRFVKLNVKALLGTTSIGWSHRLFSRSPGNPKIMSKTRNILCLFDVDGTLTAPRKVVEPHIYETLMEKIKPQSCIGLVGGSDFIKMAEQMGGEQFVSDFDYVFPENGLIAFNNGKEIGRQTIQSFVGEERLKKFINYTLLCLSEIDIPVKRGTFIEFRTGMLNISPIGRSCSRAERNDFEQYDKKHHIRQNLIKRLQGQFHDFGFTYSIGGQISFDVFPTGWDKTYSLNYVEENAFKEIHFFGDKVHQGGNDFEIYNHPRVVGHKVTSPEDTMKQLRDLFKY